MYTHIPMNCIYIYTIELHTYTCILYECITCDHVRRFNNYKIRFLEPYKTYNCCNSNIYI